MQGLDCRRLLLTAFFGGALISKGLHPELNELHATPLECSELLIVARLSLGTCAAPVGHYWYQGLDYLLLRRCGWPQASARFVLSKVRLIQPLLNHLK